MAKAKPLPFRLNQDNRHVCHNVTVKRGSVETTYATGKVYHRSFWRDKLGGVTGEHMTLNLGDDWYRVYRNTEVQSWSQSGSFD
jgi:hypothetical protein